MPQSRQLAVVMFADIIGYTAMMQRDEAIALEKLTRFKNELKFRVKEFKGRIIQYYGDGCLITFTDSSNAVNFARIVQKAFRPEPQIPVRIGIHLGDILINDGNIFGDSVNISSRIQSIGGAGTVLVSEAVRNQIKNKPEFQLASLGSFEFKNVEEPMDIFALTNDGLPAPGRTDTAEKFIEAKSIKSIAVLPFVNMSDDSEQEYFSYGMAEEIINSLAHLKDLKVAGRTSSFQFKGKNIDLRKVGEKLGVGSVLEGSVRRQGNRLRITAQLVDTADGYHLWSERYDREINDVFAIQDDIALAITEKLKLTIFKKDRDRITKTSTQNTEAYELYMKGRFFISRRGPSIIAAMECFQKAIDLDPGFALAYAGYADANSSVAAYGLGPAYVSMTQTKYLAGKALKLDPTLSEPYCSLGYYYVNFEWNWPEAKRNFLKSLELNPKYPEAHYRYGLNYLACIEGKFDEAEEHGKMAIKLEPLSAICHVSYALILSAAGKYEQALAACQTGLEMDANSYLCHLFVGSIYMVLQRFEEAIFSYQSAIKLSDGHHFAVNALILTYCMTGDLEKARGLMNEIEEKSKKEYITHTFTAFSAAYLEGLDKAFDYLDKACDERDPILPMIKYQPWVPPAIKEDPRFQKLLERIGFP